jgi:hypothetical protein
MIARRHVLLVGIVLISIIEAASLYKMRGADLPALAQLVHGIVFRDLNYPYFQSRVLSPYTIYLIAKVGNLQFENAYLAFTALAIIGKDLLTYLAIRRFKGDIGAVLPTAAGAALYVLLQVNWVYPWDPVDVGLSACLIYLGATPDRLPWKMIAAVYAVALLNRESSVFVGLFLAIQVAPPYKLWLKPRFWTPNCRRLLTAAAFMIVLALVVSTTLRIALAVAIPPGLTEREFTSPDNSMNWPAWRYNLELLERVFITGRNPLEIAACVSIVMATALFAVRLGSPDMRLRRLALLALIEMAMTLRFGVILELRVFSGLVPFLVLLAFSSNDRTVTHGSQKEPAFPGHPPAML